MESSKPKGKPLPRKETRAQRKQRLAKKKANKKGRVQSMHSLDPLDASPRNSMLGKKRVLESGTKNASVKKQKSRHFESSLRLL